jgi:hypothetical protein
MNNNTKNHLIQNVGYKYTADRHFALCESCFWSATIFKFATQEHTADICPVCFNGNSISLIPLTKDEAYELSIRSNKVD